MIFLEADLSRAEERVELMLGRDPRDIEQARSMPWEFDSYRLTAARMYGVSESQITKDQRYLGKRTTLAALRGLAGDRMADELSKDELYLTLEECSRFLAAYHATHPAIQGTYLPDIRKQVLQYRALVNTWGRITRWDYHRLSEKLFLEAYSFLPQSEVADLVNQWGLKPLWNRIAYGQCDTVRVNAQVHDALLLSCLPDNAYDIAVFLRDSLERPRIYANNAMTIPVCFKLGSTWAGDYEFNRLPSRDEFTAAAWDCERKRLACGA